MIDTFAYCFPRAQTESQNCCLMTNVDITVYWTDISQGARLLTLEHTQPQLNTTLATQTLLVLLLKSGNNVMVQTNISLRENF